MTKGQAISIIYDCFDKYKSNFCNKNLLILCQDTNKRIYHFELKFLPSNFLHLTGIKFINCKNISPTYFYYLCENKKLKPTDFDFSVDGTTVQKLKVLPFLLSKNMNAKMLGDYNNFSPKLYTEKLVGGIRGCMGFVKIDNFDYYAPNTILNFDIRDVITDTKRIIGIFSKDISNQYYNKKIYIASGIDIGELPLPNELAYLKNYQYSMQ